MTARLVHLHASLIQRAARAEAIAARLGDDPRAECERADAAEARATAADLAATLRQAGADVFIPDPRQLALLSDGYSGGNDA